MDDGAAEGDAFGDGGADIIGGEVIHELIFGQHGGEGEGTDEVAEERESGVVEDVDGFAPEGFFHEVEAGEAACGEPAEAGGGERDEDAAEGVAGDGEACEDEDGGDVVGGGAVVEGFEEPEGDADDVGEDEREEPVVEGDGKTLGDDVGDGFVEAEGFAEVAGEEA